MEIFYSGSSQNSDLGQEQLNNMEESAKADNTKRATKWGLNRFEEWKAKITIFFYWKTVSLKELNDILRKFYAEVKTKQGRTLSPSALTGIRASVHRFITSPPSNRAIDILKIPILFQPTTCFKLNASYITILDTLNQHTKMQSKTET